MSETDTELIHRLQGEISDLRSQLAAEREARAELERARDRYRDEAVTSRLKMELYERDLTAATERSVHNPSCANCGDIECDHVDNPGPRDCPQFVAASLPVPGTPKGEE